MQRPPWLESISFQPLWNRIGRPDTDLPQSIITILPTIETSFQGHMPVEVSLESTWMECDVLKQCLSKPHLASMKTSVASQLLTVQVRKKRDLAKSFTRKRYCILGKRVATLLVTT